MEFRLGTMQDIDSICQMIQGAVEMMESQGIHQWDDLYPQKFDFEEDIEKETLYVVYEGSNLAALYVISEECDDAYRKCSWSGPDETAIILHRFCVSSDFQNRGIGKQVLLHIEEQLKEMGYTSMRLDVFTQNPFAQKLYRKDGFQERGYADWRKGRFDLMEKEL